MNDEPKKISFGFNKLSKKSNIIVRQQPVEEKKVDIIEYLEEKAIKVVGKNDDKSKGPLIIPMKEPNNKLTNLVDLIKNNFNADESEKNETLGPENSNTAGNQLLSLEEQATRELINDSKSFKIKEENKKVIGVSKNEENENFEGKNESTIEDYEEIPIEEFGKAMLRGMGWKDGHGIGKNEQLIKMTQPLQRPKGMGLGADKMAQKDKSEKPAVDRDGNALKCVKGAYVKVIAGYHKGNYGQIIGLDDESGRFIIKMALNNLNASLNEFLVTPVTRNEYNKNSKVINNAKYEEFLKKKKLEEKNLEKSKNKEDRKDELSSEDETSRKNRKKYDRQDRDNKDEKRKHFEEKKSIKKEILSSESDEPHTRDKSYKNVKIKNELSDGEYEEKNIKKYKNEKREMKVERHSYEAKKSSKQAGSNVKTENQSSRYKDKYNKNKSKYYSDDSSNEDSEPRKIEKSNRSSHYTREESRDRKNKHEQNKSKRNSDGSSSEEKHERRKPKTKSSKYDSDSDDHDSKASYRKKTSKKPKSDEDSDEKYRRKSKKNERKKYDDSDSDNYSKKSKDKYHDKRDRSRHDRNRY